ncbi:MAG: helix-turn-helix transcriptional regulator [Marmoricola sp.]
MRNSVKQLREQAGMSQQECAEVLGVTRQTVISIEKGHFDPRLSLAFRIAAAFDRPVDQVFRLDDE